MYKNGINIIKSNNDIAEVRIIFKWGSINEDKDTIGCSHLLEHLVCKSTDDISIKYDNDGILLNAYTSSNETVYYISGLTEYIVKYASDFIDRITNYELNEQDFENEKNIVITEINDIKTSPISIAMQNYLSTKYNYYFAGGMEESVKNISFERFKQLYEEVKAHIYAIVIHINKDIDAIDTNVEFFGDSEDETTIQEIDAEPFYEPIEYPATNRSCCVIATPIYEKTKFPIIFTINQLMTFGLNSILYRELREKHNLFYGIEKELCYSNENFLYIYGFECEKHPDEYEPLIKEIFTNWKNYFTEDLFNMIKNKTIITNKKCIANNILDYKFYNNEYNDFVIDDVKYEDVLNEMENGFFENLEIIFVKN